MKWSAFLRLFEFCSWSHLFRQAFKVRIWQCHTNVDLLHRLNCFEVHFCLWGKTGGLEMCLRVSWWFEGFSGPAQTFWFLFWLYHFSFSHFHRMHGWFFSNFATSFAWFYFNFFIIRLFFLIFVWRLNPCLNAVYSTLIAARETHYFVASKSNAAWTFLAFQLILWETWNSARFQMAATV